MEILENIPFDPDPAAIARRLHLDADGEDAGMLRELAGKVAPVARPRAVYGEFYVENRGAESVEIGGIWFGGRVLRRNLDKVERAFPYVATCGEELDRIAAPPGDMMAAYCLEAIKEKALKAAVNHLKARLRSRYALERLAATSPGSLPDWPVTGQRQLFELLGDVRGAIGVRLTESCLMVPVKSVSGIIYPTEIRFESCQLCPRENCLERRAAYDPALVAEYGLAEPQAAPRGRPTP